MKITIESTSEIVTLAKRDGKHEIEICQMAGSPLDPAGDAIVQSLVNKRLLSLEIDGRKKHPTVVLDFGATRMRLTLYDADSIEFELSVAFDPQEGTDVD